MDPACRPTIHHLGWVALLLFSVTIHLWAILIANRIPDSGGVLSTALLPVISWFRLVLTLPEEFSPMRNAFATSVLSWLACTFLLVAVRRLNRVFR